MSHPGIIMLCNNIQQVKASQYHIRKARHKIIDNWKRLYGNRFYKCWLQIFPDTDENINANGVNGRNGDKLKIIQS